MELVEKKTESEIATYLRDRQEEAETTSSDYARNALALAIQRYSQDEVIERTVSTVTLPSEEMKGRIIGREGRNIRAIEQATGVGSYYLMIHQMLLQSAVSTQFVEKSQDSLLRF